MLTLCLCVAGASACVVGSKTEEGAVTAGFGTVTAKQEYGGGPEETERTDETHGLLAFDPTDERQLVGESENVFFGRVVERVGAEGIETSAGSTIPQVQFSVKVRETIKGDTFGTVVVNQELIGHGDATRKDYGHPRPFGGERRLEPGKEYLFYARYDGRKDWYVPTVPGDYAHVEIGDEAERSKEREEAKKAKANQIKVDPEAAPPADPNAGKPCLVEGEQNPPGTSPCDPSAPRPPRPGDEGYTHYPPKTGPRPDQPK